MRKSLSSHSIIKSKVKDLIREIDSENKRVIIFENNLERKTNLKHDNR
jgi:hypothetical protein